MTVCLDVEGREGARPDLEAVDGVTHIAVVDERHLLDEAFGIINVPMAVWVDEDLRIVRPAEAAWPTPGREMGSAAAAPDDVPERVARMMTNAGQIVADREWYAPALRDWAANGADSEYVLDSTRVLEGSVPRGAEQAEAAARFELGQHLHRTVGSDAAVPHFREAHRLDPGNWTYKRQAWELASRVDGPLARFWQGPKPGAEGDWPYDGDWVSDIEASGPENYYPPAVR